MKIQVIFYSMYGHVHRMAEAVAEGARQVAGVEVSVFQVAELVPDNQRYFDIHHSRGDVLGLRRLPAMSPPPAVEH